MAAYQVISGGQTGVDQLALELARQHGLETGGTAPAGYQTEHGEHRALLQGYGLAECAEPGYPARTRSNVAAAHGTLVFGDPASPGTRLTLAVCRHQRKPCLLNPGSAAEAAAFVAGLAAGRAGRTVINVAGSRGSKLTAARRAAVEAVLHETFGRLRAAAPAP